MLFAFKTSKFSANLCIFLFTFCRNQNLTFNPWPNLGENRVATPTATESTLPWKRDDDDDDEGGIQQNEFPSWVTNKDYLAYHSPSATFLGKPRSHWCAPCLLLFDLTPVSHSTILSAYIVFSLSLFLQFFLMLRTILFGLVLKSSHQQQISNNHFLLCMRCCC